MVPRAKWMQLNIAVGCVCAASSLQEQVQICKRNTCEREKEGKNDENFREEELHSNATQHSGI